MNVYFNLQRAHEEIEHLNVEIRRLRTSVYDEHWDYHRAIGGLIMTDPPLAAELSRQWQYCERINAVHLQQLNKIEQLPSFTGKKGSGLAMWFTRGSDHTVREAENALVAFMQGLNVFDDDGEDEIEESEKFVDFVEGVNE
jgi:hypothetical protein